MPEALLLAVVVSSCSAREPRGAPDRPVATTSRDVPAPASSPPSALASAAPAPSAPPPPAASSGSAPSDGRPAIAASMKETEAILRDVCPVEYLMAPDGSVTGVGCADCLSGEPFDPSAFSSTSFDAGTWVAGAPVRGAFTQAGADEVFVQFAGACNPKHGGYALLARKASHWSIVERQQSADTGHCRPIRRDDGRDVLVCDLELRSVFGDHDEASIVDLGDGSSSQSLVAFAHVGWDLGAIPKGIVEDGAIRALDVADLDHDGRLDVVISVDLRRAPSAAIAKEGFEWRRVAPTSRKKLVFLHDGVRLVADAETKQFLDTWAKNHP
jgi:hypothetical protein